MKTYLIWSEEHGAWWKAGKQGYTRSIQQAGRYELVQATEIVGTANQYLHADQFAELVVPDPLDFNKAILAEEEELRS